LMYANMLAYWVECLNKVALKYLSGSIKLS
jgi:hypothetical protein